MNNMVFSNKYSLTEMAEFCGVSVEAFSHATPKQLTDLAEAIGEKKSADFRVKQKLILATAGA